MFSNRVVIPENSQTPFASQWTIGRFCFCKLNDFWVGIELVTRTRSNSSS